MNAMRILSWVSCLFVFAGVGFGADGGAHNQDVDILFHGRVVDQYYTPVAKAHVVIEVCHGPTEKSSRSKSVVVTTDKDGSFTLTDRGSSIYIERIEKSGYEFDEDRNPDRCFEYSGVYAKAVFVPEVAGALLFRLRKTEGEPAYLIHKPAIQLIFSPGRKHEYNLDLVGTWIDKRGLLRRTSSKGHADLNITCALSKDRKAYVLSFACVDTNSGVIVSQEPMESAPAEGYEPEATAQVNIPQTYEARRLCLYAKIRGGQVYSRLDLELTVRPSNLLANVDVWTNPDGSRNLKHDRQFQSYEKKRRYNKNERRYQARVRQTRRMELTQYQARARFQHTAKSGRTSEISRGGTRPGYQTGNFDYSR